MSNGSKDSWLVSKGTGKVLISLSSFNLLIFAILFRTGVMAQYNNIITD